MKDANRCQAEGRSLCISMLAWAVLAGLLLSGCGKKEGQESGLEYGYMAEEAGEQGFSYGTFECGFRIIDGYLYYMDVDFYRVPLEGLDFSGKEQLYSQESLLETPAESIAGYDMDEEGNLYYISDFYEAPGLAVYKCSDKGERVYRAMVEDEERTELTYYSNGTRIAADEGGNAYVVCTASLLQFDDKGNCTGKIDLADKMTDPFAKSYLMKASDHSVFLFIDGGNTLTTREVYRVKGGDSFQLEAVETFGQEIYSRLYMGRSGLLINDREGGILHRYDEAEETVRQVLRWEDVDVYSGDVQEVVEIGENRFLVFFKSESYVEDVRKYLILSAVPWDQMPQKERIVLASLSATEELKKTVVQFNRDNSRYHVSIESYGAKGILNRNDAAYTRLDSALASKEGPDILDLTHMDILKYVDAHALEDLYSYMEESDIKKEDYLANLLEGYTMDGKLVTIPRRFHFSYLLAAEETVSEVEDWSMESVIALSGRHPDISLLPDMRMEANYLMGSFCADYYLEKYVDWEAGSCEFDSEGFCSLLEWVAGELKRRGSGEESLLASAYAYNYMDHQFSLVGNDNKTVLLGFPSVGGESRFSIEVMDALSILKKSEHKEGAWEFVQFFLKRRGNDDYGFPTNYEELDTMEEKALEKIFVYGRNGELLREMPRMRRYSNGVETAVYAMEQKEADALRNVLVNLDFTPRSAREQAVVDIVKEEAEGYLTGAKSLEDVAKIIQNRAAVVVQENQ